MRVSKLEKTTMWAAREEQRKKRFASGKEIDSSRQLTVLSKAVVYVCESADKKHCVIDLICLSGVTVWITVRASWCAHSEQTTDAGRGQLTYVTTRVPVKRNWQLLYKGCSCLDNSRWAHDTTANDDHTSLVIDYWWWWMCALTLFACHLSRLCLFCMLSKASPWSTKNK